MPMRREGRGKERSFFGPMSLLRLFCVMLTSALFVQGRGAPSEEVDYVTDHLKVETMPHLCEDHAALPSLAHWGADTRGLTGHLTTPLSPTELNRAPGHQSPHEHWLDQGRLHAQCSTGFETMGNAEMESNQAVTWFHVPEPKPPDKGNVVINARGYRRECHGHNCRLHGSQLWPDERPEVALERMDWPHDRRHKTYRGGDRCPSDATRFATSTPCSKKSTQNRPL